MRIYGFVLLLFSLSTFAKPHSIIGKYQCSGKELGSSAYFSGTMTIKRNGNTYSVESHFKDGSSYRGTGVYQPKAKMLAVAFASQEADKHEGVLLAEIDKSVMKVLWTYSNQSDIANASCVKLLMAAKHKP